MARDRYGLELPEAFCRLLAWRCEVAVRPGSNLRANELRPCPFEGSSGVYTPECIHPVELVPAILKPASRPGLCLDRVGCFEELMLVAAWPSQTRLLVESVSKSETASVLDSPILSVPSLGLAALAALLGFGSKDMPNMTVITFQTGSPFGHRINKLRW